MIKLCVFDMGGVMVRDYQMAPELLPFLGLTGQSFADLDKQLLDALHKHSRGEISEDDFWTLYPGITGKAIPPHEGSLFGKFFRPKMDEPTLQVVKELKAAGMRVVVGTNVIDAHYAVHQKLNQYAPFEKVYASHLMGIAKPDPEFYFYILKAEGIKASEVFFTDDSKENVNSAVKTGLNAFTYTDAAALREQLLSLGLTMIG